MTEDAFYLVWAKNGPSPTKPHRSMHDAENEARRLASANPGKQFVVMQSVAGFTKADVIETRYEVDLPF